MGSTVKHTGRATPGQSLAIVIAARRPILFASLLWLSILLIVSSVKAQDTSSLKSLHQSPSSPLPNMRYFTITDEPESLPVRQRANEEYDAGGLRYSSFLFFPSITATPFYDSNVYATQTMQRSSTGVIFLPRLTVESDWNNHQVSLDLLADHFQFFEESSETRTNARATLSGRLDVRQDMAAFAAVSAARQHEQRGTSNQPSNAAEPVPYDEFDAALSVVKSFNRVDISAGVTGEYRDYHDVPAVGGGTLSQDYRDGIYVSVGGRIAYLMKPGIRIFGDARYNWRQYKNQPGVNADSHGYNLLAGLEFTLTTLMRGEIGIGYLGQTYEGAGFGEATGIKYSANLIWNPTPLMTVTLNGERKVDETGLTGSPGRTDSSIDVTLDYELRRNLIVSPSIAFTHEDYVGSSRRDNVFNSQLNIDYLINRNFSIGAGYSYTVRDSNFPGNDYDRHYVSVNAQAKF